MLGEHGAWRKQEKQESGSGTRECSYLSRILAINALKSILWDLVL